MIFDWITYWPFLISIILGAVVQYFYVNPIVTASGKSSADTLGWWLSAAIAFGTTVGVFELIEAGSLASPTYAMLFEKILIVVFYCGLSVVMGMIPVAVIAHLVKPQVNRNKSLNS